jgi:voltage-gated potassium channel
MRLSILHLTPKIKAMLLKEQIRDKVYQIIFGTDTKAGRLFDVLLLWAIILSVSIVMLESVESIGGQYRELFRQLEWGFTILFTLEYMARIFSLNRPMKYIFSFYGIIDLLSILPSWLGLLNIQSQYLIAIRLMRLLRVFRIFKLSRHLQGMRHIRMALKNSGPKITVFFMFVIGLVTIMGTLMYMVEGNQSGFSSIPQSIYWAIVTLTTVGYGDITPVTVLGKMLASVIMIMGYSIIAVPTGIVSSEMTAINYHESTERVCGGCGLPDHELDAKYCRRCGKKIPDIGKQAPK